MKKLMELVEKFWENKNKRLAEIEAELKVEHEAATDYYERTGNSFHILGSVEQRRVIEAWREKNDLSV